MFVLSQWKDNFNNRQESEISTCEGNLRKYTANSSTQNQESSIHRKEVKKEEPLSNQEERKKI